MMTAIGIIFAKILAVLVCIIILLVILAFLSGSTP